MKHSKKVEIEIPRQDQLVNQLRIILKLAEIGAYDIHGRIRAPIGGTVEGSDVSHLLHCVSPQGTVPIEAEFLAQLRRANVDPSWILNDDVRQQLTNPQPPTAIKAAFPKIPEVP